MKVECRGGPNLKARRMERARKKWSRVEGEREGGTFNKIIIFLH